MADEHAGAGPLEQVFRQAGITRDDLPVAGWDPVPPAASVGRPRPLSDRQRAELIESGRRFREYDWPAIPATAAIAFRRHGDRSPYETPHFARRAALAALALAVYAGADDLTDDLVDGIWAVCEESFWGVSAHVWRGRFPDSPLPDTAEPYIDLFAAATAGTLAWVDRLAGHVLTGELAIVRDRIRREVQRRVLGPYVERDDWWWLGLAPLRPDQVINNWNPWIHSNILTATLLLEADPARREVIVRRAIQGLDRFLATYAPDGGCDEGNKLLVARRRESVRVPRSAALGDRRALRRLLTAHRRRDRPLHRARPDWRRLVRQLRRRLGPPAAGRRIDCGVRAPDR